MDDAYHRYPASFKNTHKTTRYKITSGSEKGCNALNIHPS